MLLSAVQLRTADAWRGRPFLKESSVVIGTLTSRLTEFFLILPACLFLVPKSGEAAEFNSVQAGYQRQAQVGVWMPIRVSAVGLNPGHSVSLVTTSLDPRGNPFVRTCGTAEVDPEGSVIVTGLSRIGRVDSDLKIALVETENSQALCSASIQAFEKTRDTKTELTDEPVQRFLRLYRHDVRFLLTIGQLAGIDELLRQATESSPYAPLVVGVSIDTEDALPSESQGYDLFSTIIFTGGVDLTDQQLRSLKMWIHAGGRLIVSFSSQVQDLLATPFGKWLHARFDFLPETRQATDSDLGALQQIVPRSTRISTNRRPVEMVQVRAKQPMRLAEATNGPLVARIGSGGGQVTLVSLDLNRRPLSHWNFLPDFYAVLILGAPLSKTMGPGNSARISSAGVSDMSTQLMAAVDPVPKSGRWTTWSVMALAFGWLLLIGPVDYLIVVVLLRRPHFTWVTFPLWVIAGFAVLYLFKAKSSDVVLNSVHLLDVAQDGDEHSIQALSLLSVSSPRTSRVDLKAESALYGSDPGVLLTWVGRPEDVYGGMYRTTGIGASNQSYTGHADATAILRSVPLLTDGSFESQARWAVESTTPLVESSLKVSGFGLLGGAFKHHLPISIHDWYVVYGNRLYRARDDARTSLPAGQFWSFRPGSTQISDLRTWLGGRREMKKVPTRIAIGQLTESSPYNSRGGDLLDIVTMMSLHQAAGGKGYTGLNHHLLRRLDMSEAIRMNYAMVFGWSDEPATHLEMDGLRLPESSSKTIVRLLLPVDRRPAEPSALSDQMQKPAKKRQPETAERQTSDTPSTDKTN